MKTLEEIACLPSTIKMTNEILYNLKDFEQAIQKLDSKDVIIPDDFILLPFYVKDGKRLELYEFQLHMVVVEKKDFEAYLLSYTSKESLEDIPIEIIERQKDCYIEVTEDEKNQRLPKLIKYIGYLRNSLELQSMLKGYLGEFIEKKLYFELY